LTRPAGRAISCVGCRRACLSVRRSKNLSVVNGATNTFVQNGALPGAAAPIDVAENLVNQRVYVANN
jgi:DNA-binding beta-propeller fold protein YncE